MEALDIAVEQQRFWFHVFYMCLIVMMASGVVAGTSFMAPVRKVSGHAAATCLLFLGAVGATFYTGWRSDFVIEQGCSAVLEEAASPDFRMSFHDEELVVKTCGHGHLRKMTAAIPASPPSSR